MRDLQLDTYRGLVMIYIVCFTFPHNTRKGVSLVLANTNKGTVALNELQDVFIEERELQEALVENHNLKSVSRRHPQRDDVIKAFLDCDISLDEINDRYHLLDNSLKGKVKTLADKTGFFDVAKAVYDYYKIQKKKK